MSNPKDRALFPEEPAAARGALVGQTWEYKRLTVSSADDRAIGDTLNRLGQKGWELITATDDRDYTSLYLRRRKQQEGSP